MAARAIVLLAVVAVGLTYGGCGEQRDAAASTTPTPLDATATAPDDAIETLEVSLSEYRLTPSDPRLARPGLIAFVATNDGLSRHALRVDGPAGEVTSRTLAPGERTTITVRLPAGTYKWYGPIADDERRGMVGRVRVAE